METLTAKFGKLFQVELLLHHLLDDGNVLFDNLAEAIKLKKLGRYQIGRWIEVRPTPATVVQMTGHRWAFRPTATGFLVATATTGPNNDRPAIPPSESLTLDFELVPNDGSFGQFSAFPLPGKLDGQRAMYVFDNSLATAQFPNLTVQPPTFNMAETYEPGTIVFNGGSRFVAKRKTQGNPTVAGINWDIIAEALPYANTAQLVSRSSLGMSDAAFGVVRIRCADGLGNFGLFNGPTLRSPTYKVRLRRRPT